MYAVDRDEMRKIDKVATEQWLLPELLLMENAARSVVEVLGEMYTDLKQKRIVILAGKGNNGGDALAIARQLHNLGCRIKIFLLTEGEFSPSAQSNMDMLKQLNIKVYPFDDERSLELLKAALSYTDLLLDGMFGIGVNRELSPMVQAIIGIVNKRECDKIAIDIPSGLNCDTGEIMGACFKAQTTISMQLPKRGFYINEGPKVCGDVRIVNIHIPTEAIEFVKPKLKIIDKNVLKFKSRPKQSHKGDYGHLLVIGGAVGTGGAMVLCAKSALRCGTGLVSALVSKDIYNWVASSVPQVMVHPFGNGSFLDGSLAELEEFLEGKDALAVGCGMGVHDETKDLLRQLLNSDLPMVIDADGLNILAQEESISFGEGVRIITPHPKEMARLCNTTVQEVQANRLEIASNYAKEHHVWVVLKGNATVVASPDGTVWLNTVDSVSLAKAGSGDVLCGIVASLLAQGYSAEEACTMGVYIHGAAGVVLEKSIGVISANAEDIINVIDQVIRGEMK